jgi:hypothetical protein
MSMQKLSRSPSGVVLDSEGDASPSRAAGELESPSLFVGAVDETGAPAAYELKFLLTEDQAAAVTERVRTRLSPDPHSDPELGGAYRTTSIYTDTPRFDVLHRNGDYATSKCRVRRYGTSGPIFLERKDKDGNRVRKCRATVPADDLAILSRKHAPDGWVGGWFHQQLALRELSPVCRITYERVAFMGATEGGTVRVTFDRNIRGEPVNGWAFRTLTDTPELLPGLVVCEFKFRVALPLLFKEVVEALALTPTTVSKYRRFCRATGLGGADRAEPGASATGCSTLGDAATGSAANG